MGTDRGGIYFARSEMTFDSSWDTTPGRDVHWRYASDTESSFPAYSLEYDLECSGFEALVRPDWRWLGLRWQNVAHVSFVVFPLWIPAVTTLICGIVAYRRLKTRRSPCFGTMKPATPSDGRS